MTISNSGNASLTVSGIGYPTGFSGNWSGTIPSGGSRAVTVTFAPLAATAYSGTIVVNGDQTGGTNTIGVSGAGTSTLGFTDDPLQPGVTGVKASHVSELRAAIDILRARYALPAATWTDQPLASGTVVKAVHLTELRVALAGALVAAGGIPPVWTPATVVPGSTVVTVAQVVELRTAVAAIWQDWPPGPLPSGCRRSMCSAGARLSTW